MSHYANDLSITHVTRLSGLNSAVDKKRLGSRLFLLQNNPRLSNCHRSMSTPSLFLPVIIVTYKKNTYYKKGYLQCSILFLREFKILTFKSQITSIVLACILTTHQKFK